MPLALDPGQSRPKFGTNEYKAAWAKANREKVLAAKLKWAESNREKTREKNRRYREEFPNKRRLTVKSWADRNPDKVRRFRRESMRRWYQKDLAKSRAYGIEMSHRRRAMKVGNGGRGVSPSEWRSILDSFGGRCAYCGDNKRISRDHVVPLARGGRHEPENIVPACRSCNSSKNLKLFIEWGGSDKPICI